MHTRHLFSFKELQIQLLCSSSGASHSGVSETLLFGLLILKLYCICRCVSIQVILAVSWCWGVSEEKNKSVSFVVIKDVLYNNRHDGNEAAVVNRFSNKHVLISVEIMS